MIANMLGVTNRRVNGIMKEMHDERLVKFIERRNGRIYKLTKKGANVMSAKYLQGWSYVEHRILRNWFLLYENNIHIESPVKVGNVHIQPDAIIESNIPKFIEIDRLKNWKSNLAKLDQYASLKRKYESSFIAKYGRFPVLIWVVQIESRKNRLVTECEKRGIPYEVMTAKELLGRYYEESKISL